MAETRAEERPDRVLARQDLAPERRFLTITSLAGMAFVAAACWLLHVLSLGGTFGKLSDALFITPYWTDAAWIHAGFVPYRDIQIEYPPLALPVFVLPAILPGGGLDYASYRTMFEVLMTICVMGLVPITAWTIDRVGGRRDQVLVGVGLVVLTPLLFGPLTISRYDPWPALLTAGATLAMVSGRPRLGFALLALGTLAKVYPAFLAPIFAWYAWRTAGRREALIAIGLGLAVGLAGLGPFLAIDPGGTLGPFTRTLARPLQMESLGTSVLAALHDWFGLTIGPVTYGFDSYNLGGPYTAETSGMLSGAFIGSLVVLTALAVLGPARPVRFVVACAGALALTVALGKVLSPQYVIWLLAAVAVTAPVGPKAIVTMAVILVLTQIYFPARYDAYLATFDVNTTVIVLERNLGLLGLGIYFVAVTRRLIPLPVRHPGPPADRAPAGA